MPTTRTGEETFNPWSIVNLVFHHLASEGLHPVLGEAGDPGVPAAALLRALGITPAAEGNRQASEKVKEQLAELRAAFDVSHVRGRDLGNRGVMQNTRTFGAVGGPSSRKATLAPRGRSIGLSGT